jgi:hypothetical protein
MKIAVIPVPAGISEESWFFPDSVRGVDPRIGSTGRKIRGPSFRNLYGFVDVLDGLMKPRPMESHPQSFK